MAEIRDRSLAVFRKGHAYAAERGIILADTKFEWGRADDGQVILIDECLTPDSSRFWPAESFKPGRDQPIVAARRSPTNLRCFEDSNAGTPTGQG